jgi:hypothetical protein
MIQKVYTQLILTNYYRLKKLDPIFICELLTLSCGHYLLTGELLGHGVENQSWVPSSR